jgi:desulfoferrodoxin (superoxide reductase-like protein)
MNRQSGHIEWISLNFQVISPLSLSTSANANKIAVLGYGELDLNENCNIHITDAD